MKHSLKKLATQLYSLGLYQEAFRINALVNRAEKRTKLYADPSYQKNIQYLLKSLGLSSYYNIEDSVELLSAAAYLKEGITDNNLLLAGLSIASLIPTLKELKTVVGAYDTPANSKLIIPAAELIIKNQGMIKAALDKFKDPKLAAQVKYYVPDGKLLTQHADGIWNALKDWAMKAQKPLPPTEETPTEVDNPEDIDAQVEQMLTDLNAQL